MKIKQRIVNKISAKDFANWIANNLYDNPKDRIAFLLGKYTNELIWKLDKSCLTDMVKKDLARVDFDFENINIGIPVTEYWHDETEDFCFHTIHNDSFAFLLCQAGGDWENFVYFILYLDKENNLRGYIPHKGNTYCKRFKCAYGNLSYYMKNEDLAEKYDEKGMEKLANFNEMFEDIESRFIIE